QFEKFQDEKILEGGDIWGPFKSEEEWQLAKWLIKNVGHTQAENFLWLNILLDMVNQLPGSIDWKCECVTLTGNIKDNDGHAQTEELELWI
ncbi:hypothetical protein SCLCIDRAFT_55594, partial [Scleroderma citrinum Foug A]